MTTAEFNAQINLAIIAAEMAGFTHYAAALRSLARQS